MKSYWQSIQDMHKGLNIPLHVIFVKSGIPTSTYYRTLNGTTELRYETARKIYRTMELLAGASPSPADKRKLK
jgi:predicted transcriptional regulator|tara:strand:- start:151 stop:369 length:219 start_codon:yes stop_codon:yes gene_type:complete